ncbi:hypothetical protein HGRIS_012038 [Hohenbuehelia grisea]|uniref:Uncharacterized protein n=1 Tax=Hohenbuehelia grisea TaxID=104357 RepID=A0ABR3IR56_9AGAR
MADLIISAKSGSDWTRNELAYFNIKIRDVEAPAFFNRASLPPPSVPPGILQNAVATPDMTEEEQDFFNYLEVAMIEEESAVDDFAAYLFRLFRYNRPNRIIRTKKEMSFIMGGKKVSAKADVTIQDQGHYLLLVQENKRNRSTDDATAQLMAECIAAFENNKHLRTFEPLRPPLEHQVIPGITMVGSTPVFFRATITTKLQEAVATMRRPSEETIVLRFIPPVPDPASYYIQGMNRVDNRLPIMQCFEAFKDLLGMPA